MKAFNAVFVRDLRVAFRRWSELAYPLIFFLIVVALFPLALSSTTQQLREVGTGVLWVAALLSSLLALDGLFRGDADDGTLEQLLLSPVPMTITVLAKIAAHALVTLLPLICLVPATAWSYNMPPVALPTLALALLLAAPTLSVLIALGAALTVSLRRGGSIVGLLVLPLTGPLLIFGTRATDLSVNGEPPTAPLLFLAALAVLAVSLGPLAIAAAVKVGLE
ncbi:MAG TPA: heme exporter protein CcmB [Gammaproteobacteria bacterium]|nr:heme exporter protein CcmB [Gammaproteobacteria bacterium]